jgi:polyisoprenyl-teichoic acid--peptidoglycan teichoic acid transferase
MILRVTGTGNGGLLRRRTLMAGAVGAAGLLVGGGATFAVRQIADNRYAIPEADLFGTPDPTPSESPSASPSASPTPSPTPPPAGADIKGPLNILLAGVDTRVEQPRWQPNADAVMILSVAAGLERAYLFSLPRDLVVTIPRFGPSGYGGGRTKLTHAMAYGSRRSGKRPSTAQGFQLLARTVSAYTGIQRFDAGAVLNFGGLVRLVDALGGIDIYIDTLTRSRHKKPDGSSRPLRGGDHVGAQMVYRPGNRHLVGWQALDYSRQRYGVPGGDYGRQRHQQQVIRAVARKIGQLNVATNPLQVDRVVQRLGDTLTFDGRGRKPIEYAYALRDVRPETLKLIVLPGSGVGSGGSYAGEALRPIGRSFISALRTGRAEAFLGANPSLVVKR